jgi:hypothetical protein
VAAGGHQPTNASLNTLSELEAQLAKARADFQSFSTAVSGFNSRFGGVVTLADRPVG